MHHIKIMKIMSAILVCVFWELGGFSLVYFIIVTVKSGIKYSPLHHNQRLHVSVTEGFELKMRQELKTYKNE